ncbi:helix-turn-helix domain-containing protein [Marinomonas posidonica]
MTQEQIALEADMATSNVSRIEKGLRQPSQKVLWKLAEALNTSPAIIYAASEQPDGNILDFLEKIKYEEINASYIKKNKKMSESIISKDAQLILKLYSELSPKNKFLLLEQLKTLHKWQEKPHQAN